MKEVVKRELTEVSLVEGKNRIEIDTGSEIGMDNLVETSEFDEVVYALRVNRDRYSRFVKNKKPKPTAWLSLSIDNDMEGEAMLYTAFLGKFTPSFPGGTYLPEKSKEFWSTHALVWGVQEIIPETVTAKCPW